jgi:ABC-type Na+ efflux pump permease subunit
MERETRVLFRKEWRQLVASKAALATGSLLPIFMLGIVPAFISRAGALDTGHAHDPGHVSSGPTIGLFGEIGEDPRLLAGAMLPLMVAMVAMLVPTMMASHLLITERERRTLELLVALPVRIEQVLLAKLMATLLASSAMTLPILLIDMIALPLLGSATLEQVLALPILLAAGLALSTSIALLMSLLSPDFRAANNIAGALLAPTIISTMMGGMLLPGGVVRPLGIAVAYTIVAAFVLRYALRTVTFERLLS